MKWLKTIFNPMKKDSLRIVVIGGVFGNGYKAIDSIGSGDILILQGPFATYTSFTANTVKVVLEWLAEQKFTHKVMAFTAYDGLFSKHIAEVHQKERTETLSKFMQDSPNNHLVLGDTPFRIAGIDILNVPAVCNSSVLPRTIYGFNSSNSFEIVKEYEKIPKNLDILLTSDSPRGYFDTLNTANSINRGSATLKNRIREVKPAIVITAISNQYKGVEWLDSSLIVSPNYNAKGIGEARNYPENTPIIFDYFPDNKAIVMINKIENEPAEKKS